MSENVLFTAEDIKRGFYPLRPIQRWIIDTHFNKAKSTMMNLGALIDVDPKIDIERFVAAINDVVNSYDIFRSRLVFHPEKNELCQRFDGEITPITIEKVSEEEFEQRKKELAEPYHLINNQLWRIKVFSTPTKNYMYVDFYHAMVDGTVLVLLFAYELNMRYQGKKIKRVPAKYADYIAKEMEISPEELEEGHKYWRDILKDLDIKKHLPPPDVAEDANWGKGTFEFEVQNINRQYFSNKARKEGVYFLAASMLTIAKLANAESSIMNWLHNGRVTAQERRLMGLMIEQLPIAWDFSDDCTVEHLLNISWTAWKKKLLKASAIAKVWILFTTRGLKTTARRLFSRKKFWAFKAIFKLATPVLELSICPRMNTPPQKII